MRSALERWRGTIAYVILALAIATALWQNRLDNEDRTHQAKAVAAAQTRTLRVSCEDRNDRDRKIIEGLTLISDRRDADPDDLAILIGALAPRDCDAVYPMPG